jgi:hypothetical protein
MQNIKVLNNIGKAKYVVSYWDGKKKHKKELKDAKQAKEEAILYELKNHECFYTGSIEDVVDLFNGVYSKKDILTVFKKYNK